MDEWGELMGEFVFEVIEFVGDPMEPRCDELGERSLEDKCEPFGDAIDDAIDDGGASVVGGDWG